MRLIHNFQLIIGVSNFAGLTKLTFTNMVAPFSFLKTVSWNGSPTADTSTVYMGAVPASVGSVSGTGTAYRAALTSVI